METSDVSVPRERIECAILMVRGKKVMLDSDLAELYQVDTRVLVQAVKRNLERFPKDFMFQLSDKEYRLLIEQSDNKSRWGGRRYPPFAFTEQGVAMLSTVLRSQRAIQVNIEIMRAFTRLRKLLSSQLSLAIKLKSLEERYDNQFNVVFEALRILMDPNPPEKRRIGFLATSSEKTPPDQEQS